MLKTLPFLETLNTLKAGRCLVQDVSPGFRLQQQFIPERRDRSKLCLFNAPRAHQETHQQPQLSCHPVVPRSQNIKTLKTLLLQLFDAILTTTLALAKNALALFF